MSQPISLTDAELTAVMDAARPIPVGRRDAFLQELAVELSKLTIVGAGNLHRAIAETQRRFWDPPTDTGYSHAGKHAR
jgi:hypothetical protein